MHATLSTVHVIMDYWRVQRPAKSSAKHQEYAAMADVLVFQVSPNSEQSPNKRPASLTNLGIGMGATEEREEDAFAPT
ncbi:Hypothetical protein CINCED_3A016757 [Cinara cedri]|uniref:Uncharacterized protein n=1 Tax=Cinara cedri TaxID=506608 RepID=A0A5E4NL24_9HEMI|nr:Hypothetical protein CINCED_3A016757 [Cinara cedri]